MEERLECVDKCEGCEQGKVVDGKKLRTVHKHSTGYAVGYAEERGEDAQGKNRRRRRKGRKV